MTKCKVLNENTKGELDIIDYKKVNSISLIMFVGFMMFNVIFNNISVKSWLSVLLMDETGGPGKNHRPVASHRQTLSHNVVHHALIEIRTHNISGDSH